MIHSRHKVGGMLHCFYKRQCIFSINEKVTQWIELKLKGYGLLDISDVLSSLEKTNQLKHTTDPNHVLTGLPYSLLCMLLGCLKCQ